MHSQLSNHDNVVRLYDHKETDDAYEMYMEYCDKGGALADKVLEVSYNKKISDLFRIGVNCSYLIYSLPMVSSLFLLDFRGTRLLEVTRN